MRSFHYKDIPENISIYCYNFTSLLHAPLTQNPLGEKFYVGRMRPS